MRQAVERLKSRAEFLNKKGDKKGLELLRDDEFLLPKAAADGDGNDNVCEEVFTDSEALLNCYESKVGTLLDSLEESDQCIQTLYDSMAEQAECGRTQREELARVKYELENLKQIQKKTSDNLNDTMKKLGNVSARNVNKKIKRRDLKIKILEEKNKQQTDALATFEANKLAEMQEIENENADIIDKINKKLDTALKAKEKAHEMKMYY